MNVIDVRLPEWCTSCGFALAECREVTMVATYITPKRRTTVLVGYCADCLRHDPELAPLRTFVATIPIKPDAS